MRWPSHLMLDMKVSLEGSLSGVKRDFAKEKTSFPASVLKHLGNYLFLYSSLDFLEPERKTQTQGSTSILARIPLIYGFLVYSQLQFEDTRGPKYANFSIGMHCVKFQKILTG